MCRVRWHLLHACAFAHALTGVFFRNRLRTLCIFVAMCCMSVYRAQAGIPSPLTRDEIKTTRVVTADQLAPEDRIVRFDHRSNYPEHLMFGGAWQDPKRCGPNSLYVLLSLMGKEVTRGQVDSLVPITDRGTSLEALSRAADALGLRHRLMKVSQKELYQLPAPLLVHEKIHGGDPTSDTSGHFYVITHFIGDGRFGLIDGVSATYSRSTSDRIDRSFSGYVLVPEESVFGLPHRILLIAASGIYALVIFYAIKLAFIKRGDVGSK